MSATQPCLDMLELERLAAGGRVSADRAEHLVACDACRCALQKTRDDNRFLSGFARNGVLPPMSNSREMDRPFEVPGYRIVREIHRGGQGVVYLAVQQSTHREVAIKVMKQGPFATLADRARFEREVETLGKLDHPNIIAVHDAGVAAGFHYFVMHHVEGRPLNESSADAEIDDRLDTFIKVCDAVHAAHLRGIIHRDLKPSNIRVDNAGEPHVLDFGLAKSIDSLGESEVTQTGQFVGSLPWASPEQVGGHQARIDLRTDVYSLGAMLYHLLAGVHPYPLDGSMVTTIRNITEVDPPPPSSHSPRIDGELDTIVLKALAKDPARRYQSAGELARDLRHFLADEPIEARRDSNWYLIRKTAWRKRRLLLALCLPALLLPIAGVAMYRSDSATRQAAHERRLREIEAGRNAAMLEITRRVQARPGSAADSPGGRLSVLNANAIHTDLDTGSLAVSDYGVAMLLAETLRDRGTPKAIVDAEGLVRQAMYMLARDQGAMHPEIGKLRTELASMLLLRGTRMPEAEQAASTAVDELTAAFGPASPETARARIMLARIRLARRDFAGAMTAAQSALGSDAAPGSTHLVEARATIAAIHAQQGQNSQARETYLDALRAMLRAAHDTDSRVLDVLELGASMIERGVVQAGDLFDPAALRNALADMKPAAALHEVAAILRGGGDGTSRDDNYLPARFVMISLRERLLGPSDPTLGASLASAASSQLESLWQGRPYDLTINRETESLALRALPLQIAAHGADSPLVGQSYNLLGTCLIEAYRLREATQWFIKDCNLWMRQPAELRDDYQIMLRSRWIAWHATRTSLFHSAGPDAAPVEEYQLGLHWADESIQRVNQTIGSGHGANAMMFACRSVCLAGLGRAADSLESEKIALGILGTQPVPEDQRRECNRFLGAARLITNRLEEARDILEPQWKIVLAKPANTLEILEWSAVMRMYYGQIADRAQVQKMDEYIRENGRGDITSASASPKE